MLLVELEYAVFRIGICWGRDWDKMERDLDWNMLGLELLYAGIGIVIFWDWDWDLLGLGL
jgi:hypothetical protein